MSSLWTSTSPQTAEHWFSSSLAFFPCYLREGFIWLLSSEAWLLLTLPEYPSSHSHFPYHLVSEKRVRHPLLWPGPGAQVIQWGCIVRLPLPAASQQALLGSGQQNKDTPLPRARRPCLVPGTHECDFTWQKGLSKRVVIKLRILFYS